MHENGNLLVDKGFDAVLQLVGTDFDRLVGCAYSCPVQLDDVDGAIALSLDTLSRMCERDVRACSVFPP